MTTPSGGGVFFDLRGDFGQNLDATRARSAGTQGLGKPLQRAVLEGVDDGLMHIALAADRRRIAEIGGGFANGIEHLSPSRALVAGSASASASSTETDANSVRKSLSDISTPAISRKKQLTSCAFAARKSPASVRY